LYLIFGHGLKIFLFVFGTLVLLFVLYYSLLWPTKSPIHKNLLNEIHSVQINTTDFGFMLMVYTVLYCISVLCTSIIMCFLFWKIFYSSGGLSQKVILTYCLIKNKSKDYFAFFTFFIFHQKYIEYFIEYRIYIYYISILSKWHWCEKLVLFRLILNQFIWCCAYVLSIKY